MKMSNIEIILSLDTCFEGHGICSQHDSSTQFNPRPLGRALDDLEGREKKAKGEKAKDDPEVTVHPAASPMEARTCICRTARKRSSIVRVALLLGLLSMKDFLVFDGFGFCLLY